MRKQSMKKKSQKLKKLSIKIRDFIVDELWVYLIVLGSIALVSWLFDKWIEGIMFCIAHTVVRGVFSKQFHFHTTSFCLSLTLQIIWFVIPSIFSVQISLLASIPVSFVIAMIGYIVQELIDTKQQVAKLERYSTQLLMELQAKSTKDIYAMTEDELYEHCRSCGLDEEDCKIAYFIVIERLKGKELYHALPYGEATIKRKRLKIMSKIQKDKTTISF